MNDSSSKQQIREHAARLKRIEEDTQELRSLENSRREHLNRLCDEVLELARDLDCPVEMGDRLVPLMSFQREEDLAAIASVIPRDRLKELDFQFLPSPPSTDLMFSYWSLSGDWPCWQISYS